MRKAFTALLALFIIIVGYGSPAIAETVTTASIGFKTENFRPGGGKFVSDNPVLVTNGQVTDKDSGLYVRGFSTAGLSEKDDEIDLAVGAAKPCLGWIADGIKCRGELSYWMLPKLDRTEGDIVNAQVEVSGSHDLGNGTSAGLSVRAEQLFVIKGKNTQVFWVSGNVTHAVEGVPVRLQAGVAYNRAVDRLHAPVGLYATIKPSWLPKGMSITPSVEALIPLNHRGVRETGFALGLALGTAR